MGRAHFLQARLDYIAEMLVEGDGELDIAEALDLDDLGQVRLLIATAQDQMMGRTPRLPGTQ